MARIPGHIYRRQYPLTGLEGFEEVMKNLNKELLKIKGNTTKGMVLAAEAVRRATETTPPLTPVDTGNLRASWFVVTSKQEKVKLPEVKTERGGLVKEGKFKGKQAAEMTKDHKMVKSIAENTISKQKDILMVMMGYSANYAVFVHEGPGGNPEARFKRRGAGIKWFEAAVTRNKDEMIRIIRDNAKIK